MCSFRNNNNNKKNRPLCEFYACLSSHTSELLSVTKPFNRFSLNFVQDPFHKAAKQLRFCAHQLSDGHSLLKGTNKTPTRTFSISRPMLVKLGIEDFHVML